MPNTCTPAPSPRSSCRAPTTSSRRGRNSSRCTSGSPGQSGWNGSRRPTISSRERCKPWKMRFFTTPPDPTIFSPLIRLQPWMTEAARPERMAFEQDQRISEVVEREQSRLRNFIRRRVPDPRDAEDILQDVFFELVEANRLLMPIDHVAGWLFRVARNRITDLFRKKKPENLSDEDLLPSPHAGPEAQYLRELLI